MHLDESGGLATRQTFHIRHIWWSSGAASKKKKMHFAIRFHEATVFAQFFTESSGPKNSSVFSFATMPFWDTSVLQPMYCIPGHLSRKDNGDKELSPCWRLRSGLQIYIFCRRRRGKSQIWILIISSASPVYVAATRAPRAVLLQLWLAAAKHMPSHRGGMLNRTAWKTHMEEPR